MWKYLSYLALIAIIAGLAFQNFQLQSHNAELSNRIKQLGAELGKEKNLEQHLQEKVNQEQHELTQQMQVREADLKNLFQQLTSQRTLLEQFKQRLNQLKSQGKGKDVSALQTQIQKDQDRLKILKSRLSEYQNAEKDAAAEGNQNLNLRKTQANSVRAELSKQIKLQEQALKETDKQIVFWKKRTHDINQYNKLSELSKQREDQQAQLDQLQSDKRNVFISESQSSKQIKGTIAQEKEELKDTEGQIRQQIKETELDLQQLHGETEKEATSKAHRDSEIRDAQGSYDQQNLKVLNLTNEYERKRSEFEQLKK